jgi:hypothetical protein
MVSGCSGVQEGSQPPAVTTPPDQVDLNSQVEDLLITKEDFPVQPTVESEADFERFALFFSDLIEQNNACEKSNSLYTKVSELTLVASRAFSYEEDFSFIGQWVFESDSSMSSDSIFNDFSENYFDERCSSTTPLLGFYESVSMTDTLPVGFKGHAWVTIFQLDPDLSITRSISTNGRYLMMSASMAVSEGDYLFSAPDSSKMVGKAIRSFTDADLPG